MKLPQISMIIGLAVLLNFSIPITWANKKIAIIAGSAGGGAAAVIGGALWYKLRNYNGKVEATIDGEKLAIDNSDAELFSENLLKYGIDPTTVEELANEIDSALSIKEKKTNEIETPDNKVKTLKMVINTNGEEIKYTVTENNQLLIENYIDSSEDRDDEKAGEISSTELNETPGDLDDEVYDYDKIGNASNIPDNELSLNDAFENFVAKNYPSALDGLTNDVE